MCDFLKYAGGVIFGAAVGCGFGLASFWLQRRWIAQGDFHVVIDDLIAKLHNITRVSDSTMPSVTYRAEDFFLQESITVLVVAARRVRRHISEDGRNNLDAALADYKAYQAKYRGITGRCKIALEEQSEFAEAIHAKLEKIDECISNRPVD